MNYTISLSKLQEQVRDIDRVAQRANWQLEYDGEVDALYFSPKILPEGFTLLSLSEEIAVFVNKKSELGGIFIEYFKSNFSVHDQEITLTSSIKSELLDALQSKKTDCVIVPA